MTLEFLKTFLGQNLNPRQKQIFNMMMDQRERTIYPIFRPAGMNSMMIHQAVLNPKVFIRVPTEKRKEEILSIAPSIKNQIIVG